MSYLHSRFEISSNYPRIPTFEIPNENCKYSKFRILDAVIDDNRSTINCTNNSFSLIRPSSKDLLDTSFTGFWYLDKFYVDPEKELSINVLNETIIDKYINSIAVYNTENMLINVNNYEIFDKPVISKKLMFVEKNNNVVITDNQKKEILTGYNIKRIYVGTVNKINGNEIELINCKSNILNVSKFNISTITVKPEINKRVLINDKNNNKKYTGIIIEYDIVKKYIYVVSLTLLDNKLNETDEEVLQRHIKNYDRDDQTYNGLIASVEDYKVFSGELEFVSTSYAKNYAVFNVDHITNNDLNVNFNNGSYQTKNNGTNEKQFKVKITLPNQIDLVDKSKLINITNKPNDKEIIFVNENQCCPVEDLFRVHSIVFPVRFVINVENNKFNDIFFVSNYTDNLDFDGGISSGEYDSWIRSSRDMYKQDKQFNKTKFVLRRYEDESNYTYFKIENNHVSIWSNSMYNIEFDVNFDNDFNLTLDNFNFSACENYILINPSSTHIIENVSYEPMYDTTLYPIEIKNGTVTTTDINTGRITSETTTRCSIGTFMIYDKTTEEIHHFKLNSGLEIDKTLVIDNHDQIFEIIENYIIEDSKKESLDISTLAEKINQDVFSNENCSFEFVTTNTINGRNKITYVVNKKQTVIYYNEEGNPMPVSPQPDYHYDELLIYSDVLKNALVQAERIAINDAFELQVKTCSENTNYLIIHGIAYNEDTNLVIYTSNTKNNSVDSLINIIQNGDVQRSNLMLINLFDDFMFEIASNRTEVIKQIEDKIYFDNRIIPIDFSDNVDTTNYEFKSLEVDYNNDSVTVPTIKYDFIDSDIVFTGDSNVAINHIKKSTNIYKLLGISESNLNKIPDTYENYKYVSNTFSEQVIPTPNLNTQESRTTTTINSDGDVKVALKNKNKYVTTDNWLGNETYNNVNVESTGIISVDIKLFNEEMIKNINTVIVFDCFGNYSEYKEHNENLVYFIGDVDPEKIVCFTYKNSEGRYCSANLSELASELVIDNEEEAQLFNRVYNEDIPEAYDSNLDQIPDIYQDQVNSKKNLVSTNILSTIPSTFYQIGKPNYNKDTLFFMLITENENPEKIINEVTNFEYDYDLLKETNLFKKEDKLIFEINKLINISESPLTKISFDSINHYPFNNNVYGYLIGEYIE